jgi:UDP-N-acetylglucosamine--N-acetylmuramyl-(pentapeptide) pyrophosphoryl-undecaprenol N-acetylglucosamine transferase
VESRLVPAAGFELEKIRVGGIKNLGVLTKLASFWRLIAETAGQSNRFSTRRPAAVFSMGGYVAGPPVLAAILRGVPVVIMEPNAVPGVTNRWISCWVDRALISFEETRAFFPAGRTELTGLPVREEFFNLPARPESPEFNILITGGSQGSQRLNNAARQSWPMFLDSNLPVRFLHQTGVAMHRELEEDFAKTGLKGEIRPFIQDMPAAFADADLIVCRSGAGAVSELAAAGKPSILIPFPFAADDHQLRNAQAFEKAGAAILSLDREWTAERFFETVSGLCHDREGLRVMGQYARTLAKSGAAARAAQILIDIASTRRNNKN